MNTYHFTWPGGWARMNADSEAEAVAKLGHHIPAGSPHLKCRLITPENDPFAGFTVRTQSG